MIYLYTGLNGAGKTSSCIFDILQVLKKTPRPFYSAGVRWTDAGRELLKPIELEPSTWWDCPEGSVILIDEAQNSLPARPNSKDLPDWINQLGTHRHKGFDIYMTTPHPMQIDVFARRLVGVHIHYRRPFSFGQVTRLENEGVMQDPTDRMQTHQARKTRHGLRKKAYSLYSSAVMHTHAVRLPWGKLAVGMGFLGLIGGGVYGGIHTFQAMRGGSHVVHLAAVSRGSSAVADSRGGAASGRGRDAGASGRPAGGGGAGRGLAVAGFLMQGGRKVYLLADSSGNVFTSKECRVVHGAPVCKLGGSLVTLPDVALPSGS